MGLVTTNPHGLGRNQRFFAKEEVTYGVYLKPAATDAIKVLSTAMEFGQARDPRTDTRQTRSVLEQITGKKTVPWSVEKHLIPSGTAGTPPDDHEMLLNAIGGAVGYTNTPATSDAYRLDAGQASLRSMSMVRTALTACLV